jgi:hypothetical protein
MLGKKSFEKKKRSFLILGNKHTSLVFYHNIKNREEGRKRKQNEEDEGKKKKNYY